VSSEDELYWRFAETFDLVERSKEASKNQEGLTSSDREAFKKKHKDVSCSLGKDEKGFFVYTHRARCKSYPRPEDIPDDKVKFISSTS
jgi:hypothetical protein